MFPPLFPLLTVSSGLLLFLLFRGHREVRSFRGVVEILTLSLIAPSAVGLYLLREENFRKGAILLLLALINVALLAGWLAKRRHSPQRPLPSSPPVSPHLSHPLTLTFLLFVIFVGALFRLPSINFVRGGQDQGVYVNLANAIARTGELQVHDPLAPPLAKRDTPLGKLYFRDSYRAINCEIPSDCRGSFLPGFYLRSIDPSVAIPQFYHLHPIWMAFATLTLGIASTTALLPLFGVVSLALFALIVRQCSRYNSTAILAAALLACSPGHAYLSRFPVSEIAASLFFLASLYFFLESKLRRLPELVMGGVFAGLLFYTHITGVLFLGVLYLPLLFATYRSQRSSPAVSWGITLTLFLGSVFHGLTYSRPYSVTSWKKLGVPRSVIDHLEAHPLLASTALILLSLLPFLLVLRSQWVKTTLRVFAPSKRLLGILGALGVLTLGGVILYKGWLLGFTDHYATNRWIGRRWNLSGQGLWSVKHLTASVLALFVSPTIFLLAGVGWIQTVRRSFLSPRALLLGACGFVFAAVLIGKQTTVPYLYFFGRYLVPILTPLTILFGVLAIERVRLKHRKATLLLRGALVLSALAFIVPLTIAQARSDEGGELAVELAELAERIGPKGLVFVDKINFAEVELITPLRISFGIPTVTYSRAEYTGEPLKALMKEASDLGYTVYLLSEKDRKNSLSFLTPAGSFRLFLGSLVPRKGEVVPTLFRRSYQRAFLHRFTPETVHSPVE